MTRKEMDAAICAVIGGSGQVGEAMHGAFRAGMLAAEQVAERCANEPSLKHGQVIAIKGVQLAIRAAAEG